MIRLQQATVEVAELHLAHEIVTAAGTWAIRRSLIVRLVDRDGLVGLGVASPRQGVDDTAVRAELGAFLNTMESAEGSLAELAAVGESKLGATAFPSWDIALHDLAARKAHRPLAALLTSAPAAELELNALVNSAEEAREAVADGYGTLKVKVGTAALGADVANLRAIRAAVGENVALRCDANRAWSPPESSKALEALQPLNLDYVEDPVADLGDLASIRGRGVRLAVDELFERDPEAALAARPDVVVLKPTVAGGITRSLHWAAMALERQISVTVTSALDIALGVSAAAHVAAALPAPRNVAGLSQTHLPDESPNVFMVRNGRLALPTADGLGIPDRRY